jgi:hypothetical protein
MSWRGIINALLIMLCVSLAIGSTLWLAFSPEAHARYAATPKPIPAPQSLLRARHACSNHASHVKCRTALRHAYEALAWQKKVRQKNAPYGVAHALRLASALYAVPLAELQSVGSCESHLYPLAQNRTSSAAGLFQFLDSTWARAGVPGFSVYDPYANAIAAARLVHNDGGWREWSCSP